MLHSTLLKENFALKILAACKNPFSSGLLSSSHPDEEVGPFLTASKSHTAIAMKIITAMKIVVAHVDSSFKARLNHAYSQSLKSYPHQIINIKVINLNISS